MVNHVYFSVYNIYLSVYLPCVYNVSPMGLILFNHGKPWSTMVQHHIVIRIVRI